MYSRKVCLSDKSNICCKGYDRCSGSCHATDPGSSTSQPTHWSTPATPFCTLLCCWGSPLPRATLTWTRRISSTASKRTNATASSGNIQQVEQLTGTVLVLVEYRIMFVYSDKRKEGWLNILSYKLRLNITAREFVIIRRNFVRRGQRCKQ